MNKLLEFETSKGETVMIEVDETDAITLSDDGMEDVGVTDGIRKVGQKFESALDTVKTFAGTVIDKVTDLPKGPDEIELKLGLKFNAQSGVVIAKTSVEGNLEIVLKWKKTS